MPSAVRVPISSIGLPDPYIRKNTNNERISMWREQVSLSTEEYLKDKPDAKRSDVLHTSWFLPPIKLMKLSKPETIAFKGKDNKQYTKTLGYRIIDGVHRYLTAIGVGLDTIDAEELEAMSPSAAYALQFKLNNEGPLPFDRETRDNAVKQMAKFKNAKGDREMTNAQIGTQTGLSESQVSRILAGKSGVSAEAYKASRKAGGKGKAAKRRARPGGYDAKDFFDGIKAAARECVQHVKVIAAYVAENDKAWDICQNLIDQFNAIRKLAVNAAGVKK